MQVVKEDLALREGPLWKEKRLQLFGEELERGLVVRPGLASVCPEGWVLQNASPPVAPLHLEGLLLLASFSPSLFLWLSCLGNHLRSETLQGRRIYWTSLLEVIYFD